MFRGGLSIGLDNAARATVEEVVMSGDDVQVVIHKEEEEELRTNYPTIDSANPHFKNTIGKSEASFDRLGGEACYSRDMFDFFERQFSTIMNSCLDMRAPAESFVLFPRLPQELQRKIWFHALPSHGVFEAFVESELRNHPLRSIISLRTSELGRDRSRSFNIQLVCYKAREVFLEHYSQFKFKGRNSQVISRPNEWGEGVHDLKVLGKPRSWFDMSFDILHLERAVFRDLSICLDRYKMEIDFTPLKRLCLSTTQFEGLMLPHSEPTKFWKLFERFFPALEELRFLFNCDRDEGFCLQNFNTHFADLVLERQWLESNDNLLEVAKELRASCGRADGFAQQISRHTSYPGSVFRPVWLVSIVPHTYYNYRNTRRRIEGPFMLLEHDRFELSLRCDKDGKLSHKYDGIERIFTE